jgi:hypothetical protein
MMENCPSCKKDTLEFKPSVQSGKGRDFIQIGYFVCKNCSWKSELRELGHKPSPKKNAIWLHQHFDKVNQRLFVWVYSGDTSQPNYTFYGQFVFHNGKIFVTTTKEISVERLKENPSGKP